MLLRSSSSSSLTSWFHQQNPKPSSSPEPDFINRNLKPPPISSHSHKNIIRASSDGDLATLPIISRRKSNSFMFLNSGLDVNEGCGVHVMVDGAGGGDGGGKICGGGDGGGDWDYDTTVYYRNMIELNPNNSLILSNYAKYLKEIRGDALKAEELGVLFG